MLPKPAIRVSSVVYDDSIWVSLTNCFGRELEVVTHPCEKEDHSLFVGGRVGQPWIIYLLPDVVFDLHTRTIGLHWNPFLILPASGGAAYHIVQLETVESYQFQSESVSSTLLAGDSEYSLDFVDASD